MLAPHSSSQHRDSYIYYGDEIGLKAKTIPLQKVHALG